MVIRHWKNSMRALRMESMGITPPKYWNDVEQVRKAVRQGIGAACAAAIQASPWAIPTTA